MLLYNYLAAVKINIIKESPGIHTRLGFIEVLSRTKFPSVQK
jgi:hypothetical protein